MSRSSAESSRVPAEMAKQQCDSHLPARAHLYRGYKAPQPHSPRRFRLENELPPVSLPKGSRAEGGSQ